MRSVSEILHKTPWWALIFGGLAIFGALAVFVTPYHIIRYRDDSRSVAESRAIKREIDNTLAENAINLGRSVVRGMIERTTDPERRKELEQALEGLEEARQELRLAGTEVLRARREAVESARAASREIRDAVARMRGELEGATPEARKSGAAELRALERSLKQAEQKQRQAERELRRAEKGAGRISIGPDAIQIDIDPPPVAEGAPPAGAAPAVPAVPAPPVLAPEVATKIRRDVTGDMYRIGIGAAVILILLPLFFVAVVVKFFADRSRAAQRMAEAKRREAEYHRMSQQVTEAKLAALQAQVEPHFLYNTLASVQALTEVDPAKASEMTGHLIHYLRNALPKMRESVSTVGQEVELACAYLSILQMRMGRRLAFEIDVPAELMELPFPPLMLPSLVENAIKHGLEPQREGGGVRIGASLAEGKLRLVVTDTGRGFAEQPGSGVGLANIRERLAALYGDAARLTLEAAEPHGVVATIEVPAAGTRAASAGASAGPAAAAAAAAPQAAFASTAQAAEAAPAAVAPPAASADEIPRTGFWPRTWEVLVALERIWRKVLYYVFLGLLVVAGLAAIGLVIAVGIGQVPVNLGDTFVSGPAGVLVALAGAIVAFVAVAAALALVMLVLYGLGFLLLGVFAFVAIVVVLALSPVLAPIALIGLLIWWVARRSKPQPAPRVEPTIAGSGR